MMPIWSHAKIPWLAMLACMTVLGSTCHAQAETKIRLTDVTDFSGIRFVHSDGGTGQRYIVESVVAGLCSFDYDQDGLVDIYFVNGAPLNGAKVDPIPRCALYRNNGDFTFTEITAAAGLDRVAYGMGAVAADYDNDGDVDLYVSNFGQNTLYQNNGDGTFADATRGAQLQLPDKVGAGCAFLDIENDGDLDLYVGSYVDFRFDRHIKRMIGKHQFHPGPTDYPPSQDALFRNEGDGTFADVSQSSGIGQSASYSMGIVAFDADGDSDTDIVVVNDQRPNSLWINDGAGHFEDQGIASGLAFDRLGRANGNMGIEIGDVNRDGMLDLFTTTFQDEMPVLYLNLGEGQFMDSTNTLRIDSRLHPHVSWGCGLVDLDNDGDLDVYVACGHFMDNIQFVDDRTSVKVRDFVLENRDGRFVDVSTQIGTAASLVESSRGAAFDDFDNDGDIDVVVLNANGPAKILRNDSLGPKGFCLQLIGTTSNRDGVGAKVTVSSSGHVQTSQVVAGRGYQSGYGNRLHFSKVGDLRIGDGARTTVVTWPSGARENLTAEWGSSNIILLEPQK